MLVDDPETASDNEVVVERIRVAEAYLTCKRRHGDRVTFVTAGASAHDGYEQWRAPE